MVAWRSSSAAWRMGTRRTTGPGDATPPHFLLLHSLLTQPLLASHSTRWLPPAPCPRPPGQVQGQSTPTHPVGLGWSHAWLLSLLWRIFVSRQAYTLRDHLSPAPCSLPRGSGRDKLYIFIPNKILFLKARFALCKGWGWERKSGTLGAVEAGPQGSQLRERSGGREHPPTSHCSPELRQLENLRPQTCGCPGLRPALSWYLAPPFGGLATGSTAPASPSETSARL